jgi:hypothetical protein
LGCGTFYGLTPGSSYFVAAGYSFTTGTGERRCYYGKTLTFKPENVDVLRATVSGPSRTWCDELDAANF